MSGKLLSTLVVLLAAFALCAGCGDGSSSSGDGGVDGGDADTDTDADTDSDSDADAGFNPDDPGIHLFVDLGSVYMMNTPIELSVAGFLPTAREDFDEDAADVIPFDTCVVDTGAAPVPECDGNEDCAPEQQCLPEYDDNGDPIPGSESCVTPRDTLDLGPFSIDGFETGAIQMAYNAGQSGAYTPDGAGDGTLPAGTLAFDTTYTISGDGGGVQGLGAFDGELYVAPKFELTSPPLVEMAMEGMYGIEASMSAELALEWSGANPDGDLTLTIAGGQSDGTSVVCRVADDGAFTIPADMMAQTGLGSMAFLNMLTIERRGTGTASGDGLTVGFIEAIQTTLINIIKVE